MNGPPFATIGRIIKSHGVNGEVSFKPKDGLPVSCLEELETWIVPPYGRADGHIVDGVRPGPKGPLLKLRGIDTIEVASELGGRSLLARSADLPDGWDEEEAVLEGFRVVDKERGEIGVIEDLIVTGANDVWVVRGETFGEVLVPVIDEVVLNIDTQDRHIDVALLEGLIEEEEQ